MTIQEAIDKIKAFHGVQEHARFDKVLYGETERELTGVAVTCAATVDVIREAHAQGANLIVCHEDLFYSSFDEDELIGNVPLVQEKKKLLDELGVTVWRDHDHMHGGGPGRRPPNLKPGEPYAPKPREKTDYVFYGIMKVLGWEEYVLGDTKKPLLYEIPETDVPSLCAFLTEKFGLTGVRIVGDPKARVRRVFICEHVNDRQDEDLYYRLPGLRADVFIPLEIVDWTLSEYVRDAVQMGQSMAILEMGHFNVEEAGMKYLAEGVLPGVLADTKVTFIQSGDSFSYYVK